MTNLTQLGLPYDVHLWLLIGCCAVVWCVCGIFAAAMLRGYWFHWFRDCKDCPAKFVMAFGPISLAVELLFIASTRHGLMFRTPKPKTAQERA